MAKCLDEINVGLQGVAIFFSNKINQTKVSMFYIG